MPMRNEDYNVKDHIEEGYRTTKIILLVISIVLVGLLGLILYI